MLGTDCILVQTFYHVLTQYVHPLSGRTVINKTSLISKGLRIQCASARQRFSQALDIEFI